MANEEKDKVQPLTRYAKFNKFLAMIVHWMVRFGASPNDARPILYKTIFFDEKNDAMISADGFKIVSVPLSNVMERVASDHPHLHKLLQRLVGKTIYFPSTSPTESVFTYEHMPIGSRDFPEYTQIAPTGEPIAQIAFGPALMKQILHLADNAGSVIFTIYNTNAPMELTGWLKSEVETVPFYAILMPMHMDKIDSKNPWMPIEVAKMKLDAKLKASQI